MKVRMKIYERLAESSPTQKAEIKEDIQKTLEGKDVHEAAKEYEALPDEESRRAFLFRLTEGLRNEIQAAVDEICREHQPLRLAEAPGHVP